MRPPAALTALTVACATLLLEAQGSQVPPIPELEQFHPRKDLVAALRISSNRVRVDETPEIALVLTNVGRSTLLVAPGGLETLNARLRFFQADGDEVLNDISVSDRRVVSRTSVNKLMALRRGTSHVVTLRPQTPNQSMGLATGNYRVEVTYRNYADSPGLYDVYEKGATRAWEGELKASASISVVGLDRATEQRLIDQIRAARQFDQAFDQAVSLLGLSRTTVAVDTLFDALDRHWPSRWAIVTALVQIGGQAVVERLGVSSESAAPDGRISLLQPSTHRAMFKLVAQAEGCSGLRLLLFARDRGSSEYDETLRRIDKGCPELDATLRSWSQVQYAATPAGFRAKLASTMLNDLRIIRGGGTTYDHSWMDYIPEPPPPIERSRLGDYIKAVVTERGTEDYSTAVQGIAVFGEAETYTPLRESLERADEVGRSYIVEALKALTFRNDERLSASQEATNRYWDDWWKRHGRRSRADWAREILARHELPSQGIAWSEASDAGRAATYLITSGVMRPDARELSTHRSWHVRVAAALAHTDKVQAGRLLLRELENRQLGACAIAGEKLRDMFRRPYRFDCGDPAERAQALRDWSSFVRDVSLPL